MACARCGCVWMQILPSFSQPVLFCPVCGKAEMLNEPEKEFLETDLAEGTGEGDEPTKSEM